MINYTSGTALIYMKILKVKNPTHTHKYLTYNILLHIKPESELIKNSISIFVYSKSWVLSRRHVS